MPLSHGQRAVPISSRSNAPLTPMTPDNGINFLDNGIKLKNPKNAKTPPPPLWGAPLEEDSYDMSQPFYDGKKAAEAELKRRIEQKELDGDKYKIKAKIVYTYEPEDPNEEQPASRHAGSSSRFAQKDIHPTQS